MYIFIFYINIFIFYFRNIKCVIRNAASPPHIYLEFFSTFITRSRALLNLYRICRFYTPQILYAIFAGRSIIKFYFVIAYISLNRFLFIFFYYVYYFFGIIETYRKHIIMPNSLSEEIRIMNGSSRRVFVVFSFSIVLDSAPFRVLSGIV